MQNPMATMAAMLGMAPQMQMQAPPGMIWTPIGLVPLEKLVQAMSGSGGVGGGGGGNAEPSARGAYRQPPYYGGGGERRPPYYREGEGRPPYGPGYGGPQAPQRERTAAEQFRDALNVVRTAVDAVRDINEILPNQGGGGVVHERPEVEDDDDDSPVEIVNEGNVRYARNKQDGAVNWGNTAAMHVPGLIQDLFKWVGEQAKEKQQQQQQPQARQLPPGYVEVGPGYQPPPGYVAVPVEEEQPHHQRPQGDLPPPPVHMPPPIVAPPAYSNPAPWSVPPSSEDR
jgi:hypothetical protein